MNRFIKRTMVLAILLLPALGCGEKVTQVDPVKAEQSIQTQKAMVQQERGM